MAQTKRKYLKPRQIRKIINEINNPKHRVLFIVLYYSGRRKMEVLPLKVRDIDFENKRVFWIQLKSKREKTPEYRVIEKDISKSFNYHKISHRKRIGLKKSRELSVKISNMAFIEARRQGVKKFADDPPRFERPAHEAMFKILQDHIKRNNLQPDDYLFPGHGREKHFCQSYPNIILKKAAIKSGVITPDQEIKVHTFRHSRAIDLIEKGVPAPIISKDMGHASLDITMAYWDWIGKDIEPHVQKQEEI